MIKLFLDTEFAGGIRKHYPEVWQFTDEQLEQFALMIADRCARLVQGVPTDTVGYHTADQKIREPFGVKE